jgi:hypothetical protein
MREAGGPLSGDGARRVSWGEPGRDGVIAGRDGGRSGRLVVLRVTVWCEPEGRVGLRTLGAPHLSTGASTPGLGQVSRRHEPSAAEGAAHLVLASGLA